MKRSRARRTARTPYKADETWLIPYADLLTLLLALFIVLFASSQLDKAKFDEISQALAVAFQGGHHLLLPADMVPVNESGRSSFTDHHDSRFDTPGQSDLDEAKDREDAGGETGEELNLEKLKEDIDAYIVSNNLVTELKTGLNQNYLMIQIQDHALFDPGSAVVKTEARHIAVEISNMLEDYVAAGYEVFVAGHTDNVPMNTPEFPSNWELSAARALNFMKIMLQNESLNPRRFSAVGYGEYRPIASNDTPEGRQKNRRVEVMVVRGG